MSIDDDAPFATGSGLGAGLARAAGGQIAGEGMDAETQRAFRLNVRSWAQARGFDARESELVTRVDEVLVEIRLYELTAETAVVRATALVPAKLTFRFEPTRKSWTDAIRRKLGAKKPSVEASFDEKYDLRTDEEEATRQILGDGSLEAVAAIDAWCRVVYDEGKIEVRLDTPGLAGRHLLRARDLAVALARARVSTSAYR